MDRVLQNTDFTLPMPNYASSARGEASREGESVGVGVPGAKSGPFFSCEFRVCFRLDGGDDYLEAHAIPPRQSIEPRECSWLVEGFWRLRFHEDSRVVFAIPGVWVPAFPAGMTGVLNFHTIT